VTGMYVV